LFCAGTKSTIKAQDNDTDRRTNVPITI
ncbi:hypothetical protein DFH77_005475, partial [Clostridium beijerinckii]|nr:hypothetical protein [Clostridium beijerinckii]